MSKTRQGARDRAAFMARMEISSFKDTIKALDSPEGKRFPVVIIDEWKDRAEKEGFTVLFNWLRMNFVDHPPLAAPPVNPHDRNQRPIQEVFGLKDK